MNICFLNMPIEYYSPTSGGAVSTITMETARELERAGDRVTVITKTQSDSTYAVGQVVPISVPDRNDLNFVQRRIAGMRRRLNQWDWPYYAGYRKAFSRAIRQLDSPPNAIITFNDLVTAKYLRELLPDAKIGVWLQNEQRTCQKDLSATIAATNVFFTCSQYIKDWTCRTHGIDPNKIVVAHSGVDCSSFHPSKVFPSRDKSLRAIFVGRIDPNKGPDIAADAVAAVRHEGLNVCLTVAGGLWFYGNGQENKDPYFQTLKPKLDTIDATWLGHVTRDRLPALIREHDVAFVLSRSNEPFALVTLEAMASGCAVISSNRGGLPESCGGAALLVDPDRLNDVTDHLRRLATDEELLQDLKRKSVERARQATWAATAGIIRQALLN